MLILASCSRDNTDNNMAERVYSNLFLVQNSPDFPGDPDVFSVCEKKLDESCHRVISKVRQAIAELKSLKHNKALDITIKYIDKYCVVPVNRDDSNIPLCEGVLTSIYLFNKKDDDIKLIKAFSEFSKSKNALIFNRNRNWYYNRKNTDIWLQYVENVLTEKQLDLQVWRFKQSNIKPFGLLYFEVPVPLGNNVTY